MEVGSGLNTEAAVVNLELIDRVGASGVGEGVSAGESEFSFGGAEQGWPSFTLPESDRSDVCCGRGGGCCCGCGWCGGSCR